MVEIATLHIGTSFWNDRVELCVIHKAIAVSYAPSGTRGFPRAGGSNLGQQI